MTDHSEKLVPKVHPLDRELLADDPMELMASLVHGDPALMLRCMIEEYLWMGWNVDELFGLFQSSEYPVLQSLLTQFGAARVRDEIEALAFGMGGVRVTAVVDETPDPDLVEDHDDDGELIQLSLRRR